MTCDQRTPVDVKLQETPRKDEQGDEMNHNESIPSTNNNMRRICGIHRERRDPPLCVETIRRCLSNDHLKLHSLSKQTTLRINMQIRASTTHTFIHSKEATCNTTHNGGYSPSNMLILMHIQAEGIREKGTFPRNTSHNPMYCPVFSSLLLHH